MPLVSCIMPTRNRRRFVGQAIFYFLRQDYPEKELIIVDDGEDTIADLIPKDERIRYVHLERAASVGAKRNLACVQAHGELIAHWDDDDWTASNRLTVQVSELLTRNVDLCGAQELLYYHLEASQAWLYRQLPGDKISLAGGTLLYRRSSWQECSFSERDDIDCNGFVAKFRSDRIWVITAPTFYITLLHTENSIPPNLKNPRWQQHPINEVTRRLGQDQEFYMKLRPTQPISATDPRNAYSVTCIMPTYNRRTFVPQAIRYFMRQDYPRRELIIVDDSTEPVEDLIPADNRIRYIRLNKRVSIGEKRNLACEAASGDIIILWDDDDWYATNRITYQVMPLLRGTAEVTGLTNTILLSLPTWQFWACNPDLEAQMFANGTVSGTLAYWKALLNKIVRFPDSSLAEDAQLMWLLLRHGARLERLPNTGIFIYVRHTRNTWQFEPGRFLHDGGWRKINPPDFMSEEDLNFYARLGQPIHDPEWR